MLTLSAFFLFFAALLYCLITGKALYWAIFCAIFLFLLVGRSRHFSWKQLLSMMTEKLPKTLLVVRILFLIGIMTGLWRSSGTIAFFIYYGIRYITPSLFILAAFLLTVVIAYALGTSFGVASTAGVVLMAIARAGGVDPLVTAGAIMSGLYFGDRNSPTSSSASLVAAVTETDLYDNVRMMFRTALPIYGLCLVLYGFLSFRHPLTIVDDTLLSALSSYFQLKLWVLLPALIMLTLPLFKVPLWKTMLFSIISALLITVLVQGVSLPAALRVVVLGFHPEAGILTDIVAGGGLVSMITPFLLLPSASMLGGLLEGIGLLTGVQAGLRRISGRIGLLASCDLVGLLAAVTLCNQTIVILLEEQLLGSLYREQGQSGTELAMDIENSGVLLSALVPWCIACSVPLATMEVGLGALPYSFLVYLIPLLYLLTKRFYFPERKAK